jgi:hypothetical protein
MGGSVKLRPWIELLINKEGKMNMFFINWRPEVRNKVELQRAISELYKKLQLVMNAQDKWECFMPPLIHLGD